MAMTKISKSTASGSASLDITSGIDSTYRLYIFTLLDIHPATDQAELGFQVNASDESGFAETTTSAYFFATLTEVHGGASLSLRTDGDQHNGTAYQILTGDIGNDNDQCCSGQLWLFNPSDTTYVTHFYSRINGIQGSDATKDNYVCGYFNETTGIDEISFKFSSGNIDSGTITMYGVA